MFLPELGKQIQGERDLSSNNRKIRISAGSNNLESTVLNKENERLKKKLSSKSQVLEKLLVSGKSELEIQTEIKAKSKKES